MRAARQLVLALVILAAATIFTTDLRGQSLTRRTPNIYGAWVTSPWNLFFAFNHRFRIIGDENLGDIFGDAFLKNSPTFNLALGLWSPLMAGVLYSSEPAIVNGTKGNEWFPYLKWAPLRRDHWSVSLLGGYNSQAESADGVLAGQLDVGGFEFLGEVRGFSDALHTGEGGLALAGGLSFRVTAYIALSADVGGFVAGPDTGVAWSGGIALGIPFTPHTFSLQVSNAIATTPQQASFNSAVTRGSDLVWGFEFTVPFSGFARWGRLFDPRQTQAADDGRTPARVAEVDIKRHAFQGETVLVPEDGLVRWVNRDPVSHTVVGIGAEWKSPVIAPGETYTIRVERPGRYEYRCSLHDHESGFVLVEPGG
jgi:plastocyanin